MVVSKYIQLEGHNAISDKLRNSNISWEGFYLSSFIILLNKMYGWNAPIIYLPEDNQKIIRIELTNDMSFNRLCTMVMLQLKEKYSDRIVLKDDEVIQAVFIIEHEQTVIEQLSRDFRGCFCLACLKNGTNSYQFRKSNVEPCCISLMDKRLNEISMQYLKNENVRISKISIIGKEELTIIDRFSKGYKEEIPECSFHRLYEKQVKRTPDRIAVICGKDTITYAELNERANKLANYISKNIVGNENLIGIYMERSIEFIIAILGIIKSGNAYVPIDQDTLNPGYSKGFPKSRLSFMLNDIRTKLVVTKKEYYHDIPKEGRKVLCLDDEYCDEYKVCNSDKQIPTSHLVYGIYTSGSTGYPKLTMIEHKSVINLFASIDKYIYSRLDRTDYHVVALNAPFGFDASVQQLVCLLKGYSLCILKESTRNSAKGIIDCILSNNIAVFDCTPSQLELLLNENILEKCRETLKEILVGGESIPDKMWTRLSQEKSIDIFNVYGPTECTVDSTYYLVNGSKNENPTIGKAIDNCNIYILDDRQEVVPIGSIGEIYISGYGVSRGYYNRDELNERSFIKRPNLLGEVERLYKTGDKGYYLYDGNIRYMGRDDEQVKIRSHRIELTEIVSNLCRHRSIKDALVIVSERSDYKQLIAYLIVKDEAELDSQELTNFLSDYVPKYMIPNRYIEVKEWPLGPNMKIDKKRLPLPDEIHDKGKNVIESQNELEKELADIMIKILKIKMITDTDNFMTLGGDSLRVMTLLAEIFSKYHTEIDFEEFFMNPTLSFIMQKILDTQKYN